MASVDVVAVVAPSRTCKRCGLPCQGHPAPGYGMKKCQVSLDNFTTLPSSPSTPENLRNSERSNLETLNTSSSSEVRSEEERKEEEEDKGSDNESKPTDNQTDDEDSDQDEEDVSHVVRGLDLRGQGPRGMLAALYRRKHGLS